MSGLAGLTKAMLRERKDIAVAIAGGFIAGVAGVGLFSASGYMIAQTVFSPPLHTLIVLTSIVKILGLMRALSRYAERLYTHRATFSLLSRLRTSYFAKLAPLAPGLFNRSRSGDLLARFVGDVESLQHYFLRVAYPPVVLIAVFLATVIFTSLYSIWIAVLLVLGMLASAFAVPALVQLGQRKSRVRVNGLRASLSAEAAELLYGFLDLKVYGQLQKREQSLGQASAQLADGQEAASLQLVRGQALHSFVAYLVVWSVLVMGAYLIMQGSMAGVFLAMLILAAQTVFEEAGPMANLPAYKEDSRHAAQRLAETTQAAEARPREPEGVLSGANAVAIELRDVSFQYADEWWPALRNLQLTIPAGSKTAIVGPSGAGKSTIFELLLKLRKPTSGEIRLNDIPSKELHEESIWQAANVMMQRGHFFRGTVRDNLLKDEARHSDEKLTDMLQCVQLSQLSLDAVVLEQGENLSDGEKQRLALARAMLRRGRLWLLDEPTSSLDAVTEQIVFRNLFDRAAEDTLLLITHRLRGLENVDRIVVMDQGRIAESGTFKELIEQEGYFFHLLQIERQMIDDDD